MKKDIVITVAFQIGYFQNVISIKFTKIDQHTLDSNSLQESMNGALQALIKSYGKHYDKKFFRLQYILTQSVNLNILCTAIQKVLHPIATDLKPVHLFKKPPTPLNMQQKKCEVLILFYSMGFVVHDCNRDPHVQNGHDDKPNEDWRREREER